MNIFPLKRYNIALLNNIWHCSSQITQSVKSPPAPYSVIKVSDIQICQFVQQLVSQLAVSDCRTGKTTHYSQTLQGRQSKRRKENIKLIIILYFNPYLLIFVSQLNDQDFVKINSASCFGLEADCLYVGIKKSGYLYCSE